MTPSILRTADLLIGESYDAKLLALQGMIRDQLIFASFNETIMIREVYTDLGEDRLLIKAGTPANKHVYALGLAKVDKDSATKLPFYSKKELKSFIITHHSRGVNIIDFRKMPNDSKKKVFRAAKEILEQVNPK